jgi:two-component system, LytTR family, response regulator
MKTIRALIVDDEALGRKRIRQLLEPHAWVEIAGEARDGRDAVEQIDSFKPDLLFLDVQMPEMGGFEVLTRIEHAPVIIFVTAHDQFALEAFEAHAVDYLLKPFDDERFEQALQRARTFLERHEAAAMQERFAGLLNGLAGQQKYLSRLAVQAAGRVVFLKIEEIDWIEAVGNYVNLHVRKDAYLIRGRMQGIEKQLDPDKFLRIHRSTIVNLDRVSEFHPMCKGDGVILLKDGQRLSASRSCSRKLQALMLR